jgi:Tfp pilus assembly protein PilF
VARSKHKNRPQTGGRATADLYARGLALIEKNRLDDGIAALEKALQQNPPPERQAAILFALANTAQRLHLTHVSLGLFERSLAIEPTRIETIINYTNLLIELERAEDAQSILTRAAKEQPSAPQLWLALGVAFHRIGDFHHCETFIKEALRLKPSYALANGALANMLSDRGRLTSALEHYNMAVRAAPRDARIRKNRGLLNLALGNLKDGWRDFEFRFKANDRPIVANHGLRRWTGKRIANRRLLVTAEQGLGDQTIFASFLPTLIEHVTQSGGACMVECEARLVDLFARSFPGAEIVSASNEETQGVVLQNYDWLSERGGADLEIPLGSLGGLLRPTIDSFPTPHTYLTTDPVRTADWKSWRSSLPQRPVIGFCWRSSKLNTDRNKQFAAFHDWITLVRGIDANWVCLQHDATEDECAKLKSEVGERYVTPPDLDQTNDLDEVAALIAMLDAVISAPTFVSALSPALGVETQKIILDKSWTSLGQTREPHAPAATLVAAADHGGWAGALGVARANIEKAVAV